MGVRCAVGKISVCAARKLGVSTVVPPGREVESWLSCRGTRGLSLALMTPFGPVSLAGVFV